MIFVLGHPVLLALILVFSIYSLLILNTRNLILVTPALVVLASAFLGLLSSLDAVIIIIIWAGMQILVYVVWNYFMNSIFRRREDED